MPMNAKRPKQMMTFTLDPDVVERLKHWISQQRPEPRQNAVVEMAIEEFLAKNAPVKESAQNGD